MTFGKSFYCLPTDSENTMCCKDLNKMTAKQDFKKPLALRDGNDYQKNLARKLRQMIKNEPL